MYEVIFDVDEVGGIAVRAHASCVECLRFESHSRPWLMLAHGSQSSEYVPGVDTGEI